MWFKKFFQTHFLFLYPFFAFVAVGGVLLYLWTKDVLLLAVNSRYNPASDVFFKYYTHIGDGLLWVVVAVLLILLVSKYKGLVFLLVYAFSSLPTQIVKLYLFQPSYRPRSFFWLDYHRLHFVDGVEILVSNSFPSGHTSTAFGMFLTLSHFVQNKTLSLVFFVMAFMVGYSRMYLAQHFFADVYVGSIIAVVMTSYTLYLVEVKWRLQDRPSLQNGLLYTL